MTVHSRVTATSRFLIHGAALCTAFLIVLWSAQAAAIDGYKDRHGAFVGVGIGPGVGSAKVDADAERTGLDEGRVLGLHLHGIVGGGWTDNILFGADGNWWIRTVELGDRELRHHHLSFNAVTNVFLIDGLYLEAAAGLAYAVFNAYQTGEQTRGYSEMGLSARAGAGFEFFLNGTVAAGVNAGYTRHFYQNADFDVIRGGITLRWY